ncbi:MAG: group II intron reverse transcriptase/maturase [Elusimicrobiota bacterium]
MDDKRQKIQLELALTAGTEGEAQGAASRGTESSKTWRETESPALPERLMEEVVRPENLKQALKRVRSNKGSPGIDGMTVDELPGYLAKHWPVLREQLLSGAYKPQPVKRVEIEKPDGGMRRLGIPTVRDRFIQQAVMQVLQSGWDRTFSEHSYGFRPGRSAHQAVGKAQEYIAEGLRYVVDIDLEKFFDRVNHDKLMGRLARHVADKRMLKIIRAFLNAGVMEKGLVGPTDEGAPQGGPLSPLLSNIVLDELDRELEKRGHRFVRYADDCNIYVRSERAGRRVMESAKDFIAKKLKLKVNDKKSAVARPKDRKFLGFSFTIGRQPKRRIAPKAVERFKNRVRELTPRTRGVSIERMAGELAVYLRGWQGYFSYCQTPSVLRDLDYWVRRRLRCVVWKQWKRGTARFDELRKRGVSKTLAAQTAGSVHGPWHLAWSPALHVALPDAYFISLGLPRLTVASNA